MNLHGSEFLVFPRCDACVWKSTTYLLTNRDYTQQLLFRAIYSLVVDLACYLCSYMNRLFTACAGLQYACM